MLALVAVVAVVVAVIFAVAVSVVVAVVVAVVAVVVAVVVLAGEGRGPRRTKTHASSYRSQSQITSEADLIHRLEADLIPDLRYYVLQGLYD